LPVTSDGAPVWRCKLPETILAPPVVWERNVYLLCESHKAKSYLACVDLVSGRLLARKRLGTTGARRIAVWDGRILVRTKPTEISELLRVGKGFNVVWRHRTPTASGNEPVVFEGEIYVVFRGRLLKLRMGRSTTVWTARGRLGGHLRGLPAVYGGRVYVLGDATVPGYEPSLHLFAFDRRTGALAARTNVAWYASKKPPPDDGSGEITVTPDRVYIHAPAPLATRKGSANYVGVVRSRRSGRIFLGGPVQLFQWRSAPAVHRDGVIVLSEDQGLIWLLWRGDSGTILARRRTHPDLFRFDIAPVVLGDVVYFGGWAADIETYEILWRLPVERLRFPFIPVDRGLLFVEGPRTLVLLRSRAGSE